MNRRSLFRALAGVIVAVVPSLRPKPRRLVGFRVVTWKDNKDDLYAALEERDGSEYARVISKTTVLEVSPGGYSWREWS